MRSLTYMYMYMYVNLCSFTILHEILVFSNLTSSKLKDVDCKHLLHSCASIYVYVCCYTWQNNSNYMYVPLDIIHCHMTQSRKTLNINKNTSVCMSSAMQLSTCFPASWPMTLSSRHREPFLKWVTLSEKKREEYFQLTTFWTGFVWWRGW